MSISKLNQNVTGLLVAFSSFYIMLFLLFHLLFKQKIITDTFIHSIFVSPLYVIPMFIISCIAFINFGKILAHDDVEVSRFKALREIRAQEQRLINYVKLAKIITNEDAETMVKNYIDKLEKNGLEE